VRICTCMCVSMIVRVCVCVCVREILRGFTGRECGAVFDVLNVFVCVCVCM